MYACFFHVVSFRQVSPPARKRRQQNAFMTSFSVCTYNVINVRVVSNKNGTSKSLPSPHPTPFSIQQILNFASILCSSNRTASVVKLTNKQACTSAFLLVSVNSVSSKYLTQITLYRKVTNASCFPVSRVKTLGLQNPDDRLTEQYNTSRYGNYKTKAKTTTNVSHTKYVILFHLKQPE